MRLLRNPARGGVAIVLLFAAAMGGRSQARAENASTSYDPMLAALIRPLERSANESPEAYLTRVAEAADALKLTPQQKASEIEAYHEKCERQRQNPCAKTPLAKNQVVAAESAAARAEQRAAAARIQRLTDAAAGNFRANSAGAGGVPYATTSPRPVSSNVRPAGYAPSAQLPRAFDRHAAAPPSPTPQSRPAAPRSEPSGSWALLRQAASTFEALSVFGGDPRLVAAARQQSARLNAQADKYSATATPTASGYAMHLLLKTASAGGQIQAFFNDPRSELNAARRLAVSAWNSAGNGPAGDLAPKLAQARAAADHDPSKQNREAYAALQRQVMRRELQYSADMATPGGPLVAGMARSAANGIVTDFKGMWNAGATLWEHPEKRNGWYVADTAAKSVMPVLDVAGAATGVGGVVREGGVVVAGRIAEEAAAGGALDAANEARLAAEAEQAATRSAAKGDFKALSRLNESHTQTVRETEARLAKLKEDARASGADVDQNPEYQATAARYKAQRAQLDRVRRDMGQAQMDALMQDLEKDGKIRVMADVDPREYNLEFTKGRDNATPPFGEGTTIKEVRVEKDIELCQGQNFSAGRLGKWFIPCERDVYVHDNALRDFIALPDSNGVDSIARVRIPAGTKLRVGTAGPIRSETAGRVDLMYYDRSGEAVGGGGHGGYTQIYLDPADQGKNSIADVGLEVVRVVPIPKTNSSVLLDLSRRWREAYGDPEKARAVYQDFLAESAKPGPMNADYDRFHRFFCASFLAENPGASALPACPL